MKIKGFTLMELLITISVFVVLSIIGIASYAYLLQKNEQQTIVDALRTAIQYAKIQAIIHNNPVYLVPLEVTGDWSKGMALNFLNKKTNQTELIYQWKWNHPNWSLSWSGVNAANRISCANNPTQAISNGHFNLINKQSKEHVTIILNRLGRIKVT